MTYSAREPILLVEDDDNDVVLVRRALQKAGTSIPVQVVRSGDEAIAYLAGEAAYQDRAAYPFPVLMLLDLKLPRKTGFDVLQAVRSRPDCRRLPIVIISSSNLNADINRAYDLGANSYVVKPQDFDELSAMMKQIQSYWLGLNVRPG